VALNLALALAGRTGGGVLLLEGDLRRPSVGRRITPPPEFGLAELLAGQTDLTHVLLELADGPLHVLPAGRPPSDPAGLLVSDALADLMAQLTDRYARIVIDTPPVVPYTDADLLARFGDGALVVARAGLTRRGGLLRAIASVRSVPVLGVLLNDTTLATAD
jgi:Mrp family chromosome partitioning ATPase